MNSIFIRRGRCSNGSVFTSPRIRSFNVLIVRSASLTCSFAAVVLHSTLGISGLSFSNSPSISKVLTLNPARLYTSSTRCICLLIFSAVLEGKCSAVTNLILRATVSRNGVPSTKNTSAANVRALFASIRLRGTATYSPTTGAGLVRTVLPRTLGRSGPNMALALVMSAVVTGHSGIKLLLTMVL